MQAEQQYSQRGQHTTAQHAAAVQQALQQAMHAALRPQASQPAFEVSAQQAVQFRNAEAVRLQKLRHEWLLKVLHPPHEPLTLAVGPFGAVCFQMAIFIPPSWQTVGTFVGLDVKRILTSPTTLVDGLDLGQQFYGRVRRPRDG